MSHPAPILRFFKFGHLPDHLRSVSAPFADLANQLVDNLPPGPELSVALRKLLESKDAAVRAALPAPPEAQNSDTDTRTEHV